MENQPTVPENREVVARFEAVAESHEGPLPAPETLAGYEHVLPGSAERILLMAEQEALHRRLIVSKVVESGTSRTRWGLWLGAFVALAVIGAGLTAVIAGHPWPGTVIITADLASVVGVFVGGTWFRAREVRDEVLYTDHHPSA